MTMEKQKICLKGFKNLVTVEDFKDEITMTDVLIQRSTGARKMQLNRYKHKLQIELNKFFNYKEQSL